MDESNDDEEEPNEKKTKLDLNKLNGKVCYQFIKKNEEGKEVWVFEGFFKKTHGNFDVVLLMTE